MGKVTAGLVLGCVLVFASCSGSSIDGDGTQGGSGGGTSAGNGGRTSGGIGGTAGGKAGSSGAGGDAGGAGTDTGPAGTSSGGDAGGGDAGGGDGGGADSGGGDAGGADNGGADGGGMSSGGADGGLAGAGGMSGGSGGGGGEGASILDVKPSAACGKTAPQATGSFVKYTLSTSGTKAADATGDPGPWMFDRDYYLWLPPGYDKNERYPLVLQFPGCGGNGTTVYQLQGPLGGAGVDGQVIRVGLTPPPNGINHGQLPNQGCFDDFEGDDSVDVTFYQKVIDELDQKVCYDQNRVFVNGNSVGSTIANQLLCKFAGSTDGYAIRGSINNTGDWRTEASAMPTCNGNPVASMFVHETNDPVQPFANAKLAIKRAMQVNGCTIGSDYDTAQFGVFKIGTNDLTSCKRILGCPADYPLVVCELPGNGHGSHDAVVDPGASAFLNLLKAP